MDEKVCEIKEQIFLLICFYGSTWQHLWKCETAQKIIKIYK